MKKAIKKSIKQNWKLYKAYFSVNFKELQINHWDFAFGIIAMVAEYAVGILTLFFIFDYIDVIEGWSLSEMLFLYGLNLTGFSLWSCFFINTITLPYYIRRGEFDRFLLRPIPPLYQIMLDGFDDDSWGEMIVGLVLLIIAWAGLKLSFWYLLALPLVLISACMIYGGISVLLSAVSFFVLGQSNIANLTMEIKEFAQYPLTIYPKVLQGFFTFIFPVAFAAFIPSAIFFGKVSLWFLFLIPPVAFLFFKAATLLWNMALKKYGSTGS